MMVVVIVEMKAVEVEDKGHEEKGKESKHSIIPGAQIIP